MLSRFYKPLIAGGSTCVRSAQTKAAVSPTAICKLGAKSQEVFDRESKYGAHNYKPLPVALCRGKGKDITVLYSQNQN